MSAATKGWSTLPESSTWEMRSSPTKWMAPPSTRLTSSKKQGDAYRVGEGCPENAVVLAVTVLAQFLKGVFRRPVGQALPNEVGQHPEHRAGDELYPQQEQ